MKKFSRYGLNNFSKLSDFEKMRETQEHSWYEFPIYVDTTVSLADIMGIITMLVISLFLIFS